MKRLILALVATSTLALAAPAFAHEPGEQGYESAEEWDNGGQTYGDFDQEYQHVWQMIQHGVNDRSYTRYQAARFYRDMRRIRARAYYAEQSGNYDPEDAQARLEQLHERLHTAHDAGHDRQDQYNNSGYNGSGYNGSGYNGSGYNGSGYNGYRPR